MYASRSTTPVSEDWVPAPRIFSWVVEEVKLEGLFLEMMIVLGLFSESLNAILRSDEISPFSDHSAIFICCIGVIIVKMYHHHQFIRVLSQCQCSTEHLVNSPYT